MQNTTLLPSHRLVTRRALAQTLDCTTRQITRLIASDVLPTPLRIAGRVYWQPHTIERWLKRHAAAPGRGPKRIKNGGRRND